MKWSQVLLFCNEPMTVSALSACTPPALLGTSTRPLGLWLWQEPSAALSLSWQLQDRCVEPTIWGERLGWRPARQAEDAGPALPSLPLSHLCCFAQQQLLLSWLQAVRILLWLLTEQIRIRGLLRICAKGVS